MDLCAEDAHGPSKRSREVSTEEAELWAKEEGLLFVEASAKSGVNVDAAFEQATRDILDKIRRGVFDDDRVSASLNMRCSIPPGLVSPCNPVPWRQALQTFGLGCGNRR